MPRAEDKIQSFKKLANIRVNRAIDAIRLIGNLSNKQNYEYSDSDVSKILSTLEAELKETKSRFIAQRAKNHLNKFEL